MLADNIEEAPAVIEDFIDRQGIQSLLSIIEDICVGKAEHLEENWQSRSKRGIDSPASWRRMARSMYLAGIKAGDNDL